MKPVLMSPAVLRETDMTQTECGASKQWNGETVTCVRAKGHPQNTSHVAERGQFWSQEPEPAPEPEPTPEPEPEPFDRPDETDIVASSSGSLTLRVSATGSWDCDYQQALEIVAQGYSTEREWDEVDGEWMEDETQFIERVVEEYINDEGYKLLTDASLTMESDLMDVDGGYGYEDAEVETY